MDSLFGSKVVHLFCNNNMYPLANKLKVECFLYIKGFGVPYMIVFCSINSLLHKKFLGL